MCVCACACTVWAVLGHTGAAGSGPGGAGNGLAAGGAGAGAACGSTEPSLHQVRPVSHLLKGGWGMLFHLYSICDQRDLVKFL